MSSSRHGNYRVEKVSFYSAGVKLAGRLYLPAQLGKAVPALPMLGPFCFVKEQAPIEYATRLAYEGFATLIFDPRTHGESEGTPRRYEKPTNKIADVQAAIDYLLTRPEVDTAQIFPLGICQGSSEMLAVAGQDARIRGLITVSGQYLDHANKVEFLGEDGLAMRLARGQAARQKFEATGEVDYVPIVDPQRTDVGLPHQPIWAWYHGWVPRSRWENRYAVMSDAEVWAFDSANAATQVNVPFLMVHGDHSDGPAAARRHFELVPGVDKTLIWEESTEHLQYYSDPEVIDRAVHGVADWLHKQMV